MSALQAALQSATQGNVAYDLSRFDNRLRVREAVEREAQSAARLRQVKQRARAQAIARPRVSLWAVLGFMTAMFLMFFIVYSQMQLAEIGSAGAKLKSEINTLQKEQTRLLAERDQKIDLKEIERIATQKLGMVKPSADQIIYINLSGEDHAVVLRPRDKGFFETIFG